MGFLTREQMLEPEKLTIKKVDLGNGDFVFVRQMTGRERDNFEQSLIKEVKDKKGNVDHYDRDLKDFRAKLAVNTLCDEEGKNVMKPTDFEVLSMSMSAVKLEKIATKAQELNKITDEEKENIVKNSVSGGNDDSTSGSV